jgi:hypothetical protein
MREVSLVTANWWADLVFGDVMGTAGDANIDLLRALSRPAPAKQSKRGEFVQELAAHVDSELDMEYRSQSVSLSTDYSPEGFLHRLAVQLQVHTWPMKTRSYTYPDHLTGSVGYAAPTELLWHTEDYERPICGQGQWDESKRLTRLPWKCSKPMWHGREEHQFDIPMPLCVRSDEREETGVCNRPESDEIHKPDSWMASRAHDFEASA